jgi:hypothetical protein
MTVKVSLEFDSVDAAVGFLSRDSAQDAAPAKSAKGKTKAAPAAESAPPAATLAPVAASAPAAAVAAAAEAPTYPSLKDAVNPVVSKLAGVDRDAALKILVAHGASTVKTSTSQLKPESYQAVIDETEEALDKIRAAAAQVANSGSLV